MNNENMNIIQGECKYKESILLRKYIHDIRNYTTFSKEDLIVINNFCQADRMQILLAYNDMSSNTKMLLLLDEMK